ncbi:MAG: aldo/keto reductase [Methanomicrobium sp.]|nr:aldo/keto reductase [Methanomicrobium sp.]
MLYRINPKTGDKFSALGFGAMRLPLNGDGSINEKNATEIVHTLIDAGLNYIDTAYDYHFGESESFLGRALAGGYREKVFLATKLPSWHVEKAEDMEIILDEQLRRLSTDRIDYYMLIALSESRWEKLFGLGVLDFLEREKSRGRIKHAGFSFHGSFELFKKILDSYDWDLCQIQYNYLDENYQAGTRGLEYAAKKGIGVSVMMPLRGGHLADRMPADIAGIFREANAAGGADLTPADYGYRWVLNHPEVTVVLSGMNTKEQVEGNLKTASETKPDSLTDAELKVTSRVAEALRKRMKIGCSTCGYCLPCPNGVDIPSCFTYYNNSFLFDDYATANFYYHSMLGAESNGCGAASNCLNCGECLESCPQGIDIPKQLKEVAKYFNDIR